MKRNGDSIDTIKLTLTHYKHSNPAEPVNRSTFFAGQISLQFQENFLLRP